MQKGFFRENFLRIATHYNLDFLARKLANWNPNNCHLQQLSEVNVRRLYVGSSLTSKHHLTLFYFIEMLQSHFSTSWTVIIFLFQMTLLRYLTFPLWSMTITLTILLFCIYFLLQMLVFVLQWLSLHFLHWSCSLSFHWLFIKFQRGCPVLSHSFWLFSCCLGRSSWSFERCSMTGYL